MGPHPVPAVSRKRVGGRGGSPGWRARARARAPSRALFFSFEAQLRAPRDGSRHAARTVAGAAPRPGCPTDPSRASSGRSRRRAAAGSHPGSVGPRGSCDPGASGGLELASESRRARRTYDARPQRRSSGIPKSPRVRLRGLPRRGGFQRGKARGRPAPYRRGLLWHARRAAIGMSKRSRAWRAARRPDDVRERERERQFPPLPPLRSRQPGERVGEPLPPPPPHGMSARSRTAIVATPAVPRPPCPDRPEAPRSGGRSGGDGFVAPPTGAARRRRRRRVCRAANQSSEAAAARTERCRPLTAGRGGAPDLQVRRKAGGGHADPRDGLLEAPRRVLLGDGAEAAPPADAEKREPAPRVRRPRRGWPR